MKTPSQRSPGPEELKPDLDWVQAKFGEVLWKLGRLDEALQALDKAVDLNSNDIWALGVKGAILFDQGRYMDALPKFLIKLYP